MVVKESNLIIKQLKNKIHGLKTKACCKQKENNIDKLESKRLQKNLEVMWYDCLKLNNRVKELKIKLQTIEGVCAALNGRVRELEEIVEFMNDS